MKLARCMLSVAACMGLILGLTLGHAKSASAKCGDGVTTVGEACDAGTNVCTGGKNPGAECCSNADCTGGGICGTGTAPFGNGSAIPGTAGNRDDIPNACRCSCMLPSCGDGVSDNNEQCDPGASTSTAGPCLGNAPNTVCACTPGLGTCPADGLLRGGGGNPSALVSCTNNGQCIARGGTACTGNPQCHLAQCGDGFLCSDAACTDALSLLSPGIPSPEQCDDGNTSNMDACTSFGFTTTVGTAVIPDFCANNICGDGVSNMGVEQCDQGVSVCLDGPKQGKTCCSNADCMVGNVMGTLNCSGAPSGVPGSSVGQVIGLPSGADNSNTPNSACRCNCELPFCGDGISDNAQNEECDDGTTANSPGQFCNKEQRCVGGENGCTDTNGNGQCDSNATENSSRLAAPLCGGVAGASPSACIKGTCGKTACVQNTCGDGIVGGNELCDDGNTAPASGTDTCGLPAGTLCAAVQQKLKPGCSTTVFENDPKACPPCNCILPFCGDGVTEAGEMCDSGLAVCSQAVADAGCVANGLAPGCVTVFNPNAPCCQASDCKTSKQASGISIDACSNVISGNANDIPNRCRCTCMPPTCGDGVSDTGEQCEPPASGTFCIKNAMGMCVLNTCGDGDVCNKDATDVCLTKDAGGNCIPGPHPCDTGPSTNSGTCPTTLTGSTCATTGIPPCGTGGNEQCDDANTVNPSPTNTDVCSNICGAATCGDGITNPALGEQCDSCDNGCSNGREDLNQPELPAECCFDGNVVDADKVGKIPGLISVERGFTALLGCRMPNLVGAASCDKWLIKRFMNIQAKIASAQVYLETDDITKSRRLMRAAERSLNSQSRRIARLSAPGKACAAVGGQLANETANAAFLSGGIVAHLTEDSSPFGP